MKSLPLAIAALFCLALQGCASVPNARKLAVEPDGAPPAIEGTHGELSAARGEKAIESFARFPGDDEELQRQVALEGEVAGTPLVAGNHVTLFEDGRTTYDAMMRALVGAKDTINLESFIFEADSVGQAIAGLLIDKAGAGVAVQVIYDGEGSVSTPTEFWDRLRAAGVHVLEYNPPNPLKARAGYDPNSRDHRKLLVTDGKTAIMGGINLTEIYLYGGVDSGSTDRWWLPWHDTDIQIEGPVVAKLQQFFIDTWNDQKGDPLPERQFFPVLNAQGNSYIRAVPGAPDKDDPEIYVALLSAMRHAEKRIWLTTAFFDPTAEDIQVMKEAARRGIDVELQVPGESDSQVTLAAGRSHYADLLQDGIKIVERRDVFLHGKTATIDGVWSIVGSSNLDARSVIWNKELSAIVLGADFARQMEDQFRKDLKAGVTIDLEHWANRPFVERTGEWGARLFENML
jgi:cardiolipin synthase